MTKAHRWILSTIAALAVAGCSDSHGKPAASASQAPTSVRDADPCSFLDRSVLTANGLEQAAPVHKAATARSCTWTSTTFTTMVLVRWDPQTLVDFAQAFPVPAGDTDIAGQKVVLGKSDERPACAAAFFAEKGTVVEIVAGMSVDGDKPPPSVAAACERVKTVGGAAIQQIRAQHLLDPESTTRPTP